MNEDEIKQVIDKVSKIKDNKAAWKALRDSFGNKDPKIQAKIKKFLVDYKPFKELSNRLWKEAVE